MKRSFALGALLLATIALAAAAGPSQSLRVCADPDNLPFSNDRGQGFENKIAEVVAAHLHAPLEYVWAQQGKSFVGQTLRAGKCDVLMNAPAGWGAVLTTRAYYASSYVFVYPRGKHVNLNSFDDPALRKLKIGLPLLSADGANPPPGYALARRGLESNVIGFPMLPPEKIIEAVAAGEIDVAVVWGPSGGYFAKQQPVPLAVIPVAPSDDDSSLRFTYDMSMAVRRGDTAFKDQLERVLDDRQDQIRAILREYGVPVLSKNGGGLKPAK